MKTIALVSILVVLIARPAPAQNMLYNYDKMQANDGHPQQFTSYRSGWSYGSGWHGGSGYRPGSALTTGQTSTIYTAQRTFDGDDAAQRELAWRGVANKPIDLNAIIDRQKRNLERNLDQAAEKLLKNPKVSLGPWKNGWRISGARFSCGPAGFRFGLKFKH